MNRAGESTGTISAVHRRSAGQTAWLVVDAAVGVVGWSVGVVAWSVRAGSRGARAVASTLQPLTDLAVRPPLLPERYSPDHLMHLLADAGRAQRRVVTQAALRHTRELARCLATAIDLPELVGTPSSPISKAGADHPIRSIEADDAVTAWVERVFHR